MGFLEKKAAAWHKGVFLVAFMPCRALEKGAAGCNMHHLLFSRLAVGCCRQAGRRADGIVRFVSSCRFFLGEKTGDRQTGRAVCKVIWLVKGRARATRRASSSTHTLFPPAQPLARHFAAAAAAAVHMEMAVAPGRREALGEAVTASLVSQHRWYAAARPPRWVAHETADARSGRALDVSGRLTTCVCVACVHPDVPKGGGRLEGCRCCCCCCCCPHTSTIMPWTAVYCRYYYLSSRHRDGANWEMGYRLLAYYLLRRTMDDR